MRKKTLPLLCLTMAFAIEGCTPLGPPGTITGVTRTVESVPQGWGGDRVAEIHERNRFIEDRDESFRITGTGTCRRLRVKFGDGESTILWNADLSTNPLVHHTYVSGPGHWPGPKTITAEPVTNCEGGATTQDTIIPTTKPYGISYDGNLPVQICNPIGAVRAGTVITATPILNPETKIRFSALESRGIAGAPDPALGPPFTFPFPGLRAYSLVFRVGGPGGQLAQGGTGVPFTVDRDGQLELCINDDLPSDNSGAWGVALTVDESGAP